MTYPAQLRILMFVAGFPTAGSSSRGIFNLRSAKRLACLMNVTVVYLRGWRPGRPVWSETEYEGLRLITIAIPQLPGGYRVVNQVLYRTAAYRLAAPLLRGCDVVHAVDAAGTGVIAAHWSARSGKPLVVQVIGSDVNLLLPRFGGRRGIAGWERFVSAVVCNSGALEQAFRAMYPAVTNVRTVPRGVDTSFFTPDGAPDGPAAKLPPVRFFFAGGFPSSDRNRKGGETLLAAWAAAEEELSRAGASLVLAGPDAASARAAEWRAGLRRPDLVFPAGQLEPGMTAAYLRAADAVLIPSLQEGLPNVAVEAAATARAVIGSNVGGLLEVIRDGETGILVPAGDVEAWAGALRRFALQPEALARMGARAREHVSRSYDANDYARRMIEVYEKVLPDRGGAP